MYLNRASKVQRETALGQSAGLSIVYLIIFGFYAYAFYFGGMFRWSTDEWFFNETTGKKYAGGEIVGIMFMIMISIMQITALGADVKAITEGQIGGKLAYETIDHVPKVVPGKGSPI